MCIKTDVERLFSHFNGKIMQNGKVYGGRNDLSGTLAGYKGSIFRQGVYLLSDKVLKEGYKYRMRCCSGTLVSENGYVSLYLNGNKLDNFQNSVLLKSRLKYNLSDRPQNYKIMFLYKEYKNKNRGSIILGFKLMHLTKREIVKGDYMTMINTPVVAVNLGKKVMEAC
jgi:hypothetical protein